MNSIQLERAALELGPDARIELAQKLLHSVHSATHNRPQEEGEAPPQEVSETIPAALYWHQLRARMDA